MDDQINSTLNEQDDDGSLRTRSTTGSWAEITLAALPFLLILLIEVIPKLSVMGELLTWEDTGMRMVNASLTIGSIGCLLVVFILAWRQGWPVWSATWLLFFCIPLLLLAVGLSSLLNQGQLDFTITQAIEMYVWIPLLIAVLLYLVTRLDPLKGLLAALPVIYLLWQTNMEFVPDGIELAIKVPSIALVCLTIGFILRRGDWRTGLYAILLMNLSVGALFAYAGIYHGGTLPFTAPGPNLVEVLRSLIPQYLATSAILLGPLFAWRFRQVGIKGGRGGKIAYHIALTGLLVVIMANLSSLALTMDTNSLSPASNLMATWIIVGLGIYLVGVVWLLRYQTFPGTVPGWAEVILLPLLPLGIPVILMLPFITWKWPISNLYGIPLLWTFPHYLSLSLGLIWLGLSIWVVTRRGEASGQVAAFQAGIETPILSQ
jgi:hypothetical protein